jgi:hypothetical protein
VDRGMSPLRAALGAANRRLAVVVAFAAGYALTAAALPIGYTTVSTTPDTYRDLGCLEQVLPRPGHYVVGPDPQHLTFLPADLAPPQGSADWAQWGALWATCRR